MKQLHLISLLLLIAALAACSNNSFKIDGNITNLNGSAVRVVFQSDSGVVNELVNLDKKGRFSFKGTSAQPVIVSLVDRSNKPLVMVVAANGDHIKVKGDAKEPQTIKVKGNRLNEDWQLFRDEHRAFYTDPNPSRLDASIEKYVREHPDDMLSTVLLVADYGDYSDSDKVSAMFKSIEATARPESLTQAIPNYLTRHHKTPLPRLMTLNLVKHGGGFEEIKFDGSVSLISLWANPQNNRDAFIGKFKDLDSGIRVIDVLAESDTLHWHKTIAGDPTEWKHYWAPGGPVEQGILMLRPTSMPWYAVTDSSALVIYSGPSLDAASKAAASLISH